LLEKTKSGSFTGIFSGPIEFCTVILIITLALGIIMLFGSVFWTLLKYIYNAIRR